MALGDRDPSSLTHREIDATLELLGPAVVNSWTPTGSHEARNFENVDGVWLLPGTPYQDAETALNAIDFCVKTGTPFLGTCGGFQYAALALLRSRAGVASAAHAESEPDAEDAVIVPLQCSLYGQVRTVHPVAGTLLSSICGDDDFEGFHWCGYGIAERFVPALVRSGVVVSAVADDAGAAAIELDDHPFFLGTSFQPQVGTSESGTLQPIVDAFIRAARFRSDATR
jgi:CTP synthase (UTP-ammonia lyase)